MQSGLQSKNEYILYRSMYNNALHNAIMDKDVPAIEILLDGLTKAHLKNYDFSLYDSNTFIDIGYVYIEHMRQIKELELIDNTVWFDVFEVIQALYNHQNKRAISKKGVIKWIEKTLGNQLKDKVKDLVYINVNGFEHNIMRDIVLESLNCKIWSIVE